MVIIFLLVSLAAVQNGNGKKFLQCWAGHNLTKGERLQLHACPEIGYAFALIRNCKAKTALSIADIILNSTATLVLMYGVV